MHARRYIPIVAIGSAVLLICGGLVWLVYGSLQEPPPKTKKVVTQVNVVRPPPPPPEKLPEPEVQEEVEIEEPDAPLPEPELAEVPQGPLGLDADGAAGMDGFGLAARKGGLDITQSGGDPYRFYKSALSSALLDQLSDNERLRRKGYEVRLQLWLDRDGTVKRFQLLGSTGDAALDSALETALADLRRVNEPPPPGMKNPVKLRISSRI
jgi:protein TonB